jgi:hypothetical protein
VAGGNQGNQDTENKTGQGYKCNKTVMCDCWVGVG